MLSNITINNFNLVKENIHIKKKDIKQFVNDFFVYNNLDINYIDINFLDEEQMLKMNKTYLGHDTDTDIITFNLSLEESKIIGDIYINVEMLGFNAKKYSQIFEIEMIRLIFHGCLHLLGYEDKTIKEKQEMTKMENFYLNLLYKKL